MSVKRTFKLTLYGRDEFKNIPLALECKKAIMKELSFLTTVNVKECGKKPTGGERK